MAVIDNPQRAASRRRKPVQGASRRQESPNRAGRDYGVWLNGLFIVAGSALVLAAGVRAFMYLQALPVEHIRVTGELEHIQAEAIQDMVQPALVGGFLGADLARIRSELEGLPWVYRVSVRRRWPSSLEINVREQLPIARWGEEGFLNHSGEVFSSSRARDVQSLPTLRGPEGTAGDLMASYLRLLDLLEPLGLTVTGLEVDERGQLAVTLAGGMRLMVGNREFLERLQRFVAVYPRHLAPRADEIQRVDLRYESGLAVAFRGAEEDGPDEPDAVASRVAGL